MLYTIFNYIKYLYIGVDFALLNKSVGLFDIVGSSDSFTSLNVISNATALFLSELSGFKGICLDVASGEGGRDLSISVYLNYSKYLYCFFC